MLEAAPMLAVSRWLALAAVSGMGDMLTVFIWFAVAAVAALGGFYVAVAIRRWTQREETAETFTFQDMRDMHARGQISDKEFAAMRAALLAQLDVADADDLESRDDKPASPKHGEFPDDESQPVDG